VASRPALINIAQVFSAPRFAYRWRRSKKGAARDGCPDDESHEHYARTQTEDRIELPPEKHTLQLDFGDKDH
jgi:hypothetical protein